jgi:DNA-binding response OmpR family regulator
MVNRGNILIVEDDPAVRMSLAEYLRDAGFHVETADRGTRGIEVLEKSTIDLVVVDMGLPDMSGEEFIQAAYAMSSELHFIIHTGLPGPISPLLLSLGIEKRQLLPKPLPSMEILIQMIDKLRVESLTSKSS